MSVDDFSPATRADELWRRWWAHIDIVYFSKMFSNKINITISTRLNAKHR